jgi:hypothetical protein
MPDVTLEPLEGFGLALDGNLDPAVGQVPNPAVQPFAGRRPIGEESEADALNAAADQISSREAHAREARGQ